MLTIPVIDATDRFAALGYIGLGPCAEYAEITGYHWKQLSGSTCLSA